MTGIILHQYSDTSTDRVLPVSHTATGLSSPSFLYGDILAGLAAAWLYKRLVLLSSVSTSSCYTAWPPVSAYMSLKLPEDTYLTYFSGYTHITVCAGAVFNPGETLSSVVLKQGC